MPHNTERIFVAVDLETTGLDAKKDAIIEIGAVRIQGDQVIDRFSTLINPGRKIPLRIEQITGITDKDVANAPTLAEIAPELLAFVDASVTGVIAHNAGFDLGFLEAANIRFHRPALDTFELSTILLPGMPSYSLGELCRGLGIVLEDAHRALDDAEASARLFMMLNGQIQRMDGRILAQLSTAGAQVDWPPHVVDSRTKSVCAGPNLATIGWPKPNRTAPRRIGAWPPGLRWTKAAAPASRWTRPN